MAIIACPECGKEVSDKAADCPHCGFEMKPRIVHFLTLGESLTLFCICLVGLLLMYLFR
ncbi:MAG: zinc-ribbon domain-containing protein [Desulfovibrio sp.]|jgi:NAD-dependent SIR2 family protein deacetylase|nr:zinc-ribbon domain-containing protein [Desulfovibrio sp.]